MRKKIFTLLLGLITFGLVNAQTVIFDPATYSGDLLEGMTVVQIDGVSYLQVVVDGWNSTINIPEVSEILGTQIAADVKFAQGTPTINDGLTLDKISSVVQLMDTVNKVPASWDASQMIPANTGLIQNPTLEGWSYRKADIGTGMKMVHQVQFFGQETVGWQPTVGDTIWVGKIMSVDASVLMDPATLDVSTLPDGMEVVDLNGEKVLKVTLDGWNTTLPIPAFDMGKNNTMTFKASYDPGTSGIDNANGQLFVQAMGESGALWAVTENPAPSDLTELSGDAKSGSTVTGLQLAVQETSGNWDAVIGGIMYLGKVTVSYEEAQLADPPATTTLAFSSIAKDIDIDGLYDDAYDASPVNVVDRVAVNDLGGDISKDDSYGEWMAVGDLDNFYFYIEINDDDMIDMDPSSTQPWMNDGIELFMDIQDRRYVGGARISGEQHQFRINLGTKSPLHGDAGDGVTNGMDAFFGDNDTTDIEYAIVKGSLSYTIEARIPWATWFRTNSNTSQEALDAVAGGLTKDKKVAFEVSILDANAPDGRKSILNWANNTGTDVAYQTNEYWGEISFTGDWPVGIREKFDRNELGLYPNPASNQITVTMNNASNIQIYNMLGSKVMDKELNGLSTVNISDLINGVYIVRVTDINGKVAVSKFNKK